LEELGVLVQANGNFFIRRETERMAMKMLRAGRVHLIGSDCHGLESRRPNVKEAAEKIERKLGREALSRIGELEERIFNQLDLNGVIE
jgi:protein-tyrosine phosphatase